MNGMQHEATSQQFNWLSPKGFLKDSKTMVLNETRVNCRSFWGWGGGCAFGDDMIEETNWPFNPVTACLRKHSLGKSTR